MEAKISTPPLFFLLPWLMSRSVKKKWMNPQPKCNPSWLIIFYVISLYVIFTFCLFDKPELESSNILTQKLNISSLFLSALPPPVGFFPLFCLTFCPCEDLSHVRWVSDAPGFFMPLFQCPAFLPALRLWASRVQLQTASVLFRALDLPVVSRVQVGSLISPELLLSQEVWVYLVVFKVFVKGKMLKKWGCLAYNDLWWSLPLVKQELHVPGKRCLS